MPTAARFMLVADQLEQFRPLFTTEGQRVGIAPEILMALAAHESGGDPNALSPTNANGTRDYGLLQVNDTNYQGDPADLFDPAVNVPLGADVFARSVAGTGGDVLWAVSEYNRGPRTTYRGIQLTRGRLPNGLFPNQPYVEDVLEWFRSFRVAAGLPGEPANVIEGGYTLPLVLLLLLGLLVALVWWRRSHL